MQAEELAPDTVLNQIHVYKNFYGCGYFQVRVFMIIRIVK